jgi:hypothetical protein
MAEIVNLNLLEQHIIAAIKSSVDFEWIRYTSYSLPHQKIIVGGIVTGITRIYIPWWCKRTDRLMSKVARQRVTKEKMKILAYQQVIKKSNATLILPVNSCPYKLNCN